MTDDTDHLKLRPRSPLQMVLDDIDCIQTEKKLLHPINIVLHCIEQANRGIHVVTIQVISRSISVAA